MTIVKTASRWGNLYRFRYYVGGKRVSSNSFREAYDDAQLLPSDGKTENTSYGFKTTWEI